MYALVLSFLLSSTITYLFISYRIIKLPIIISFVWYRCRIAYIEGGGCYRGILVGLCLNKIFNK